MNLLQPPNQDNEETPIVVQYQELNKNYTIGIPKNMLVADLVLELAEVVERQPLSLILYKDQQLLDVNKQLSAYDIQDKGQVLESCKNWWFLQLNEYFENFVKDYCQRNYKLQMSDYNIQQNQLLKRCAILIYTNQVFHFNSNKIFIFFRRLEISNKLKEININE
ncbi:unnamed protein product [Paramecium sonneborni]|uniref:Ubiquitin-like domain-containing protein n=1 Tax=Paramecium sonneborni TaxID=65129 RepID=A0A8S1REP0_9CILI|nr:unnamed protein product [Paramecium sonneborni]